MSRESRPKRNEELAKELRCLAQVRLAQEDMARYGKQIADLEWEMSGHRFNPILRGYLSGRIRELRGKSEEKNRFVQERLPRYARTYAGIPSDIRESTRMFNFLVDDVVMGRALTLEDAVECARARKAADPFWYTFGE